jgi:uncharacterized membrane protein
MTGTPIDRKAATVAMAIGVLALGLLNLFYGDLLLQWQPAPKAAAWRMPAAYASALILLFVGVGLLIRRFERAAAALGAAWIALWVIFLHIPVAIALHGSVVAFLGIAESTAMAIGLAMLVLRDARVRRVLTVVFGICLVIFGVSHFVYAEFTAAMVPAWLPARLVIAYLTGAIHAATGVCLIFGIVPRIAAAIEALMMTSFVVLLHIPHVLATPTNRAEQTMLAIAWTLSSAAWLVATAIGGRMRRRG